MAAQLVNRLDRMRTRRAADEPVDVHQVTVLASTWYLLGIRARQNHPRSSFTAVSQKIPGSCAPLATAARDSVPPKRWRRHRLRFLQRDEVYGNCAELRAFKEAVIATCKAAKLASGIQHWCADRDVIVLPGL